MLGNARNGGKKRLLTEECASLWVINVGKTSANFAPYMPQPFVIACFRPLNQRADSPFSPYVPAHFVGLLLSDSSFTL